MPSELPQTHPLRCSCHRSIANPPHGSRHARSAMVHCAPARRPGWPNCIDGAMRPPPKLGKHEVEASVKGRKQGEVKASCAIACWSCAHLDIALPTWHHPAIIEQACIVQHVNLHASTAHKLQMGDRLGAERVAWQPGRRSAKPTRRRAASRPACRAGGLNTHSRWVCKGRPVR